MPLTKKRVAKLTTKPGRYLDQHGLYLQVISPTNRSWLLRYERGGRERWLGLGPLHSIDLDDARARARKARQQLLDGIDPIEARKAERAARALEAARSLSFEDASRQYFAAHEAKWRNRKHAAQFLSTLRDYVFPQIGKLSIASIDTGLVLRCVEPIWAGKTVTADRVRRRIEAVLDWSTVRGYRPAGDNPARWRGHLDQVLPAREKIQKTRHHAAMPYGEIGTFVAALTAVPGVAARALQFTVLTASRSGEVIRATWNEIDLAAKTWVIPPDRMKSGREHRTPLSPAALDLLQALPREDNNPFVFIGPSAGGGLSEEALRAVLNRMGQDVTVHGFRSSFRDWVGERTNFPREVAEAALAHVVGDNTERAYRRGDALEKRRRLMDAWATYCGSKPAEAGAKVVPLR
jgi:integrase